MKASIIIPVYNRLEILKKVIRTIQGQTIAKDEYEVLITDDGSSENIKSILTEFPDLNIRYFYQEDKGNRTSKARNTGIREACGDILIFNDNDIMWPSDVLEKHIAVHSRSEKALAVLGYMYGTSFDLDAAALEKIMKESHTIVDMIAQIQNNAVFADGREGYLKKFGHDLSKWYIPWLALWGGHFSVKRKFLNEHNILFDENFTGWGGEDNEFGIQLHRAGTVFVFADEIKTIHHPNVRAKESDINGEEFDENHRKVKQYIAQKHKTEDVLLWLEKGSDANERCIYNHVQAHSYNG